MAKGIIHITTQVGKAKSVFEAIQSGKFTGCHVVDVFSVTGEYDVIVIVEGQDTDHIGKCVLEGIQTIPGIERTSTSLVVKLT